MGDNSILQDSNMEMAAKLINLQHCKGLSGWYLVNAVGEHKTWTLKVFNAKDVTLLDPSLDQKSATQE